MWTKLSYRIYDTTELLCHYYRKGILVSIILELSSAMPPQTIPILPVENYLSDSHSSIPGLQWIKLDKIVPPAGQFVSVYFDSRQQRLYSVGEAVTLVCNADVIGDGSGVKFSWTLNHYTIMKSSKLERRIHYNVTTRREQTFKSYITFDPIQSGDSGTLVCLVEGDSFKTTTTHREINIKSVVNVKLSPQSVAAEVGTRATWTCKLLPNGKYVSGGKVEVVWERDGVVLRPVPDAIQMGIKSSVETTLTIYSVKSDAIISCHAENGAGPGARSESYLTVFNKALLTCPAEVSENGLTFPETNLGKTAHVPCPKSKLGLVTRDCVLSVNETALWTNTNRSNCISPQFIELEKVALAVSSGMEESTPRELCKTLVNITDVTASKEALLPKEISASVSILKTLNKIEAQSDSAGKIAPDFMTSASQALDPVNLESWEELSDTEIAGEMLGVVGDHGAMYAQAAQTDEGMKEIVKENLVLQVKRVNSVDNDGKKCKQQIRMPTRTANLPDWVLESNDMLELQWKALKFSGDSKMIGIATVQYRTISNVLPANKNSRGDVFKANSRVLSVRILPDIDYALDPPLKYTVNHLRDNQYSPRCAFWDFEMPNGGSWSTRGCKRVKTASDKNSTTCSCNHMTNFAVLMSTVSVSDALGLHILTTVGCSCSIVCCIVCIIIYIVIDFKLGKLRPVPKSIPKERKTIVINMCAALAAGNLVLMTGLEQTENRVVCATVSIVLHILWLAVFAFLLCQGVDLARKTLNYRNFMKRQPDRSKWYAFGSWGMCILIVGVCFALTQGEGYGNEYYCWLSVENGLIYAFIGPVMGVIIVNSVIVILLIRVVAKSGGTTSPNRSIKDKASQGLRALIPLVPSMGITWVFGILMLDNSSTAFQYIFTLFNSLQGLTLFLVYVLFNSRQDTMETNIGKSPGSDKLSRRRITPSSSRPTYAKHQDKTDNSCKTRRTFSYLTKTRVLPLLDVSSEEGNVEIDDSVRKIEVEHLSELPRDDSLLEQDESGDRRRDEKSFILKATSDDADGHCNPAFRDSVTENDSCRLRNKRCSQATDDTSRHSYPWLCEDGDPEFLEKMIERRKYLDSVCAVDENTAVENANRSSGDVVEKVGDSNARQRWNLLARVLNTANMRNELLESLRNQQQQTVKSNIHRDTTAFMTVL
ncbi:adhesion G protein-coupled receptor L3-like isoform X2 [Tubulanus polymorphus]|uniref:adhesion G protein-coupled receptor L3-like isoform X2 n=1 Tax=Tubulanus polymorphus TaxID=672921 RepID=UPI003DA69D6A